MIINSNRDMANYHLVLCVICLVMAFGSALIEMPMLGAMFFGIALACGALAYGWLVRKAPYEVNPPMFLFEKKPGSDVNGMDELSRIAKKAAINQQYGVVSQGITAKDLEEYHRPPH